MVMGGVGDPLESCVPMAATSKDMALAESAETWPPSSPWKSPAGQGRTHSSKNRTVSISPKAEAQMRGVKPRSSGLLMRLSPGRRGWYHWAAPLPTLPKAVGAGSGWAAGVRWGDTCGYTQVATLVHKHGHRHAWTLTGHNSTHAHTSTQGQTSTWV